MTRAEIHELVRELRKYAIKAEERDYRVILSGGNFAARHHYEDLIAGDEELQAMLILELSKADSDLRYDIEERASIVWSEGGEYSLLEAVKMNRDSARKWEEWLLTHDTGEE